MRLQSVISNFKPETIRLGNYAIALVSHEKSIDYIDSSRIDAIVVKNDQLIKKIVSNDQLYLLPLFVEKPTIHTNDGIYEANNSASILSKIDVIKASIEGYAKNTFPDDPNERLLIKTLRYLISRHKSLSPQHTRISKIGFIYPLIEDISVEKDPIQISKILDVFSKDGFFRTKIIDKVNICYGCAGSYLNFSECCTKCNSLDLKTEELVHHFRCAYVGPYSDFISEDRLMCPKCNHQLKHIGIDYDKPSEIHTCNTCNHKSQETKMKATCVDCKMENELEQLLTYDIKDYTPTEKAVEYTKKEHNSDKFILNEKENDSIILPLGAFNMIKSHETKRKYIDGKSSYEVSLSISQNILEKLNQKLKDSLTQELASIVNPYLKQSDISTVNNNYQINLLLIEYTKEEEIKIIDILNYNLNKMLNDNGWGNQESILIESKNIHL
jgi:hypothetical protein